MPARAISRCSRVAGCPSGRCHACCQGNDIWSSPARALRPQEKGTRRDGTGLTSRKGTLNLPGWPGLGSNEAWCSNTIPLPCSTTSGCLCRGAELGRGHWVTVKCSSPP